MKLKIYSNQSNQIIFEKSITNEILNQYDINKNDDDFTELFETEILSDIFDEIELSTYTFNITTSNTYYELK
tara:strand:+ start:353 stop:568 length:216 start_codon:yes stop_codon:yes gene_type:complete